MKEYVNVKELLEEADAMAKRGTLLARGEVTQEDLAMQIRGLIIHVATKEETDTEIKDGCNLRKTCKGCCPPIGICNKPWIN